MPEIKDKMIEVVNRIPREQVTSYGEVAKVVSDETQRRVTAQLI
ncbi:MAG: MGMT family protein [Candidatus Peribacteria bacterium]|nr:MAG: MGMT family protein [Candidatus Peribacteria bacterium]